MPILSWSATRRQSRLPTYLVKSSKTNNSVLILATIGVYLGLMLVGSTPVLGHAATTRNFEITDEIEIKDDLDRKPDDERSPLDMSVGNYYADLEYLLVTLQKLQQAGKFDLATDTFEVSQSTVLPCVAENKVGSYTAESFVAANASLRPTLEYAGKRMTDGYGFADCVASDRFNGQEATHTRFVLKLNADGLTLEVSGVKKNPVDAHLYFKELSSVWTRFKSESKEPTLKHISDGTVLSVSGMKVLVVTRLPRAALISLFSRNVKAAA